MFHQLPEVRLGAKRLVVLSSPVNRVLCDAALRAESER